MRIEKIGSKYIFANIEKDYQEPVFALCLRWINCFWNINIGLES